MTSPCKWKCTLIIKYLPFKFKHLNIHLSWTVKQICEPSSVMDNLKAGNHGIKQYMQVQFGNFKDISNCNLKILEHKGTTSFKVYYIRLNTL